MEWVFDVFVETFYGTAAASATDPAALEGNSVRGQRGGNFLGNADAMRAAWRNSGVPSYRGAGFGFRCARTP